MKKILLAAAIVIMLLASAAAVPADVLDKAGLAVEASASGVTVNAEKVTLYAVNSGYASKLKIPSSLKYVGRFVFNNIPALKTFKLASGNKDFTLEKGALYDKAKKTLLYCPVASNLTIPSTVTKIGCYAFYYNPNLKSITIPDSVKLIEEGAFGNCSKLSFVKIGKGVKTIIDFAFANTDKLKELVIPKSVSELGEYFYGYINSNFNNVDKTRTLLTDKGSAAEKLAKKYGIKYSTAKRISDCTATIPYSSYTYRGRGIKPTVTVKNSSGAAGYQVLYSKSLRADPPVMKAMTKAAARMRPRQAQTSPRSRTSLQTTTTHR